MKSHHLEQDDGQNSTEGEQDGHDDHDASHRFIRPEAGEGSDPATGVNTHHKVSASITTHTYRFIQYTPVGSQFG